MPSEIPPKPPVNPINRTAAGKDELDLLKLAWVQSATRIGDAERALRQAEADTAGAREALRRIENSAAKKLTAFFKGTLKADRESLAERIDNLAVLIEKHRAELDAARAARAALKENIGALEAELKKPKLDEGRLKDFKNLY